MLQQSYGEPKPPSGEWHHPTSLQSYANTATSVPVSAAASVMYSSQHTQDAGYLDNAPVSTSSAKAARTFSVTDRQVFVENETSPPSLYVCCRKWVQNDPESEADLLPKQANVLQLPPPGPLDPSYADLPPMYTDEYDEYDPEEALRRLKDHWVAVRQSFQRKRQLKCGRVRHRLKALMPGSTGGQQA